MADTARPHPADDGGEREMTVREMQEVNAARSARWMAGSPGSSQESVSAAGEPVVDELELADRIRASAAVSAPDTKTTDGASLIAAERRRQLSAEGWTPEHDDSHTHGEMVITAACYAVNGTDAEVLMHGEDAFPWGSCHDKRKKHSRERQLVIAGALIAAEIDRLRRASGVSSQSDVGGETEDTALEWLQSKLTLHGGVELLYVVDGYEVLTTTHDGNRVERSCRGPTLADAIRQHREAESRASLQEAPRAESDHD